VCQHEPPVSIIVAMADNRVIGQQGQLPWHLSADLRRFRKLTTGHSIIMGRKTYESIGRPLPQRRNIVISRDPQFAPEGVEVVDSLDAALAETASETEVFVIGGASIYALALPLAGRLYLTQVHTTVPGDVCFSDVDLNSWHVIEQSPRQKDERSGLTYSFVTYARRQPPVDPAEKPES
jgi:dihydrofolate reductase